MCIYRGGPILSVYRGPILCVYIEVYSVCIYRGGPILCVYIEEVLF